MFVQTTIKSNLTPKGGTRVKSKLVCQPPPKVYFSAGLDSVIDRVLESVKVILVTICYNFKIEFVKEAVVEAGLDPLPVPDINIPYSLDK